MEKQYFAEELISRVAEHERMPRFLLGVTFGNAALMVFNSFVKIKSFFVCAIFPLFTGTLISMLDFQANDITDIFSHIFSIGYSYLFVRFVVLVSRKFMSKYLFDHSQFRQVVLMTAIITTCTACYIFYTCFSLVDLVNLKFIVSMAVLNVLSLALTLIMENGIISDFSSVLMFSVSYGFSSMSKLKTFLSALRLIFVVISLISPLLSKISSENDHNIVFFTMKKQITRIIVVMIFLSYFLVDPRSMHVKGSEISKIPALAAPAIYSLIIFYENYTCKHPHF